MSGGGVILEGRNLQNWVWNGSAWVPMTQPSGGTGGTASEFGAAFPLEGTAAGFKDASGNMAPVELEADGSLPVTVVGGGSGPQPAGTNTFTQLALDGTDQMALAANPNRLAFEFFNASDQEVYIMIGASAAADSQVQTLLPTARFSTADLGANWVGQINVMSAAAATGDLLISELEA